MSLPPTLNASWNDTGSELTPGSRSSGKMTCSRESLCASSRASSSSSTVAASDAALPPLSCVSVNAMPPTRLAVLGGGAYRLHAKRNSYRKLLSDEVNPLRPTDDAVQHFDERGWVVLDVLPRSTRGVARVLGRRGRDASRVRGVLQHHEQTDTGPQLCRSEHFVEVHAGLRELLTSGPLLEHRERTARRTRRALQGEDQPQAPRRCGLLRTPGRARVPADRVARVGDGRRSTTPTPRTAASRWSRAASTACCRWTSAVASTVGRGHARLAAGRGARRRHALVPQPDAAPQRPESLGPARRALYPTYNAAREGDRRAAYYEAKAAAFAARDARRPRAVSLIGDFEGRPA